MNIKYRGKKILILGGGTSTLDTKWENLDYDYIWTCNEFYLEPRVVNQDIDLYVPSHTVDLRNKILLKKLKDSNTTVVVEPLHFRDKLRSNDFNYFNQYINIPIQYNDLELPGKPAGFSGICFRLILLALQTEADTIYFGGFDGFNKEFTNIHAFTKHAGLKDSDRRRTYEGTDDSYVSIFTKAYEYFLSKPNYQVLQNLGEGLDYNLGSSVSKEYFPLKKDVYEKIR